MIKIIINERVQDAMNTIMNGGNESAEWCLLGHEKECLGSFHGNNWYLEDVEKEITFLKMFIDIFSNDMVIENEALDYRQDCASFVRAAAVLIEEILASI